MTWGQNLKCLFVYTVPILNPRCIENFRFALKQFQRVSVSHQNHVICLTLSYFVVTFEKLRCHFHVKLQYVVQFSNFGADYFHFLSHFHTTGRRSATRPAIVGGLLCANCSCWLVCVKSKRRLHVNRHVTHTSCPFK